MIQYDWHKFIHSSPNKFTALFVSLLFLFLVSPFVPSGLARETTMGTVLTIILIAAIYAVSNSPRHVIIALLFAIPSMVTGILYYWSGDSSSMLIISYVFRLLFFVYITHLALFYVMRDERVTLDTIYGAISVYFLIGMTWAHMYSVLEIFNPGSFAGAYNPFDVVLDKYSSNFLSDFVYFSFVTLTNVGYGDIAPLSLPARTFAIIESAFGQLYLAILVARLVGLHIRR